MLLNFVIKQVAKLSTGPGTSDFRHYNVYVFTLSFLDFKTITKLTDILRRSQKITLVRRLVVQVTRFIIKQIHNMLTAESAKPKIS